MRRNKNVSIVTHLVREETGFKLKHSEHKNFHSGYIYYFCFFPQLPDDTSICWAINRHTLKYSLVGGGG